MTKEVKRLKNCPNCAGILDEVGRCNYCGSKIYDFLTLDFSDYKKEPTAKTYIRVRTCGAIKLIPITYVKDAKLTMKPAHMIYTDAFMNENRVNFPPTIEMDVSFICNGDIITFEED